MGLAVSARMLEYHEYVTLDILQCYKPSIVGPEVECTGRPPEAVTCTSIVDPYIHLTILPLYLSDTAVPCLTPGCPGWRLAASAALEATHYWPAWRGGLCHELLPAVPRLPQACGQEQEAVSPTAQSGGHHGRLCLWLRDGMH